MPWHICYGAQGDKHQPVVCVRIPFPWELPQPIARFPAGADASQPGDPSPWKWAESPSIPPRVFQRLSQLAAIDQLAGDLEPGIGQALQKVVRERGMEDIALPPELSLRHE